MENVKKTSIKVLQWTKTKLQYLYRRLYAAYQVAFMFFGYCFIGWINTAMLWIWPPFRVIFAPNDPEISRAPLYRFKNDIVKSEFPFKENFIEQNDLRVHYVDEGQGQVVLMLHGQLGWAFQFRKLIPQLVESGFRVVAPDFIGFGKSDKFSCVDNYTPELFTRTVRIMLDEVIGKEQDEIILVGLGWGGLIGLSVLKDCPRRFRKLILINTGAPIGDPKDEDFGFERPPLIDFGFIPGHIKYFIDNLPYLAYIESTKLFGRLLSPKVIFKYLLRMDKKPVEGFIAPFPETRDKSGILAIPTRLWPAFRNSAMAPQMRLARRCLRDDFNGRVLLVYGRSDFFNVHFLPIFENLILSRYRETLLIDKAGHFILESHPEIVIERILKFLK